MTIFIENIDYAMSIELIETRNMEVVEQLIKQDPIVFKNFGEKESLKH